MNGSRAEADYSVGLNRKTERVKQLSNRHEIFRAAKFGIAVTIGFLAAEAIIIVGLYVAYGKSDVPSNAASSPTLLALDIFALVSGVIVSFFLNERTTVRSSTTDKGAKNTLIRLGKFQGVSALGNVVTIGVQLALLAVFSLSPSIGNVIGAIVAYPVSYFISMRVVWRV
jgi:putative flippase GtrA